MNQDLSIKVSCRFRRLDLTLISMDKNAHTSAQHGSILTWFTFFAKQNANVFSTLTVATCLFSYIIFTIYEHNGHQLKYLFKHIFNLYKFLYCKKSFKFSKYKNIQESGNCSQLILSLNNNNKWIYEKHNICYAKYC